VSRHDHNLRLNDWFCGAGGSTQACASIPGVLPVHAANHWDRAIESHAANFPDVDHHQGDIRDIDVRTLPYAELFWASPECPQWSQGNGKGQDVYASTDEAIPGLEPVRDVEADRSRALMEEIPLYLRAMALRGKPVLAGVVENVIEVRKWTDWGRWVSEIRAEGYRTRLIALNSMHAEPVRTPRAPQSRDRLYLAYWHVSLGRDPDWDKWLRPTAWCPRCGEWVKAVQVFKKAGADMGRYRSQYVYRCPRTSCRGQAVEPVFSPAYTAIDWTIRGERIGDRGKPLAPKTLARIAAGLARFARPITVEAAGHTFERRPGVRTWPVDAPLTAQTTTATKGVAVPPLLIPMEGRDGKMAGTVGAPLRTQSTRAETGLVAAPPMLVPAGGSWNDDATPVGAAMRARTTRENDAVVVPPFIGNHRGGPGDLRNTGLGEQLPTVTASGNHLSVTVPPFIAELRGGSSDARLASEALATFAASGTHHGLVVPPLVMRNNTARGDDGQMSTSVAEPLRTLTTSGHQSLLTADGMDWASLYAYDVGVFKSLLDALPTQTTIGGDALVTGRPLPAVEDCTFRMLEPDEIGRGMAFLPGYVVLGNRRERVRQFGNAVTPPAPEVIVSALVEAIVGEELDRTAA
jgi:DNA (cytosine-5)-methyltransferase 1